MLTTIRRIEKEIALAFAAAIFRKLHVQGIQQDFIARFPRRRRGILLARDLAIHNGHFDDNVWQDEGSAGAALSKRALVGECSYAISAWLRSINRE
jgi:hypothetical protein